MSEPVTARILPVAEWPRLAGTPLADHALNPTGCTVVVVEQQGQIVAQWAALAVVHVEGLWIAPDVRGHAGVSRALLTAMLDMLTTHQVGEVLTQAETPDVVAMIRKAGGTRVPGETWVIPVKGL